MTFDFRLLTFDYFFKIVFKLIITHIQITDFQFITSQQEKFLWLKEK